MSGKGQGGFRKDQGTHSKGKGECKVMVGSAPWENVVARTLCWYPKFFKQCSISRNVPITV